MLRTATCSVAAALLFAPLERPTWASKQFVAVTVPSEDLTIGSAQAGVLDRLAVREGQRVKKGELLFRLTTAASQTFRVRLALQERRGFKAGLKVHVEQAGT